MNKLELLYEGKAKKVSCRDFEEKSVPETDRIGDFYEET